MLMKPDTVDLWEEAQRHFESAKKFFDEEKWGDAADNATLAILLASRAIEELSKETKIKELSVITSNAFFSWSERTDKDKHYTPKETFEWAKNTLQQLSDALPEDTLFPLN